MSLTPQFLDELRARTSLSTLIGQTVKVQKAGREYKACCPFHNEKTPSFTINDEKGFYHCFGCGAHGDAIRWMTDQRGLPFMEAVKELAQAAGMDVPAPDPRAAKRAEAAKGLHDAMAAAQDLFVAQLDTIEGAEARSYLAKRGVNDATQRAFGFGYSLDARGKLKGALKEFGEPMLVEAGLLINPDGERDTYDRFRGRLMLPIRDIRGRTIAFGGRILGQGEPKYLNSPDTPLFDKGRTLYNIDRASPASRQTGRVIVVEGYMDVVALSQAGLDDAVAPLGTALTEHQIERLWKMVDVPILCFDGDSAGQKAADRAALRALPILKPGSSLSFATLPAGMDPDDVIRSAGVEKFEAFLALATPLVERVWRYEVNLSPTDTPESRAGLLKRLKERASTITDPLVRKQYDSNLTNLFYENFGWKKKEQSEIKRLIDETRQEIESLRDVRLKVECAIHRAILLGLSRWPNLIREVRETLDMIKHPTSNLDRWKKILINASFRNNLSESVIDAILAQSDVAPVEKWNITRDLRFTFFQRSADASTAQSDLSKVIELIAVEQELDRQIREYESRLNAMIGSDWMEERQWEAHKHLYDRKRFFDEQMREYKIYQEEQLAA